MTVQQALDKLDKSDFRSSFHLDSSDKKYIEEKGLETVRKHVFDFISHRLAPSFIPNDGKQTPMSGHPVFKAQHACACCCRGCLYKWYKVPVGTDLNYIQQEKIVNLLMEWIEKEMENI